MKLSDEFLGGVDACRTRWMEDGRFRIHNVLERNDAVALRDALRGFGHGLVDSQPPAIAFTYAASPLKPDSPDALCQAVSLFFGPLRAWIADMSGLPVVPPPDGAVNATLYSRGHYLDAHSDYDGGRKVAIILGLTEESWPAEDGGCLEFLVPKDGGFEVAEVLLPGFNTLDVLDVRDTGRMHRVTQMLTRGERRAISWWYYTQ